MGESGTPKLTKAKEGVLQLPAGLGAIALFLSQSQIAKADNPPENLGKGLSYSYTLLSTMANME